MLLGLRRQVCHEVIGSYSFVCSYMQRAVSDQISQVLQPNAVPSLESYITLNCAPLFTFTNSLVKPFFFPCQIRHVIASVRPHLVLRENWRENVNSSNNTRKRRTLTRQAPGRAAWQPCRLGDGKKHTGGSARTRSNRKQLVAPPGPVAFWTTVGLYLKRACLLSFCV